MEFKLSENMEEKEPELTAVVISHNDEKTIANCLSSIKPLTTKITLLDLQSTDNTKLIAQKYNVKYLPDKFGKGEDELLNRAKSITKSSHIIYFYGYELLSPDSIPLILDFVQSENEISALICRIKTDIGNPIISEKMSFSTRLFENLPEFKFLYPKRPDIATSIFKNDGKIQNSIIDITNIKYKVNHSALGSVYMQNVRNLLKNQKNDIYFYFTLGQELYHLKKYQEAQETFKKIDLSQIEDKGLIATIYNYFAKSLDKSGMAAAAIKLYLKSIDLVHSQYVANFELAQTYNKMGKKLEAVSTMERFYVSFSDNGVFNYYKNGDILTKETGYLPYIDNDSILNHEKIKRNLGKYYVEHERFEEAVELLNDALKMPKMTIEDKHKILLDLRDAYDKLGEKDSLRSILDQLLKIDLTLKSKDTMFINLQKVIELHAEDQNMEALNRYIQIGLQSFKYSMFFHFYRAQLYYMNKQYIKALEDIQTILDAYSKNRYKSDVELLKIIELKGDCLVETGDFAKALESFKVLYQQRQDNINVLHKLGLCLIHLKKSKEAEQLLNKALSLDPENEEVQRSLTEARSQN
jgi:tetratricopeptide (TPR) repeat protein